MKIRFFEQPFIIKKDLVATMIKGAKRTIKNYILITLVSVLYGAGTSLFLSPNDLVPGGITGIAMILNRYIPLSVGTIFMIINIPIIAVAFYKFGFRFIISTFYTICCVSFFTDVFAGLPAVTNEPLLAVFTGDILIAFSIAIVFKCGATTGGADIIVKLLRLRYPHIKTGRLFMMFDISVIALSGFLFNNFDAALYAFIGIFVMSAVMDMVLYGQDEAKMVFIISEKSEMLAEKIMVDVDAGVTFLKGRGAYSKKEKEVIMCIIRKSAYPKVEEVVKDNDPDAFLIVTHANEIYGKGYKDIFANKV